MNSYAHMNRICEHLCKDKPSMHGKVVEFTVHDYVDISQDCDSIALV